MVGKVVSNIELDKELKIVNANVEEYKFDSFESATLYLNGKYYIGINKELSEINRYWILEHELEHIKTKTLYHPDDDKFTINKKERITNDSLVLKFGLPATIYKMLAAGKKKDEIIKELNITKDIYDYSFNYIIRNYLKLGGKNEK